ncbi:hypothetical protein SAMN05880570_1252 [Paenibacillus sp. RU4T]|nr:hypothetical protein SAMN05880555_1253 [Paenibacillus sp. RU4X]SIQ50418.1 hypothetical protein SAMN05880570_1252 [Paenibacillus sp. RU4T]
MFLSRWTLGMISAGSHLYENGNLSYLLPEP